MDRLVDYFLLVGAGTRLEPEDISAATLDWKNAAYKTKIISRFPTEDYKDCTFPPSLELFCFPDGMRLSASSSLPRLHYFAATIGNGERLYGCVLTFLEEVAGDVVANLHDDLAKQRQSCIGSENNHRQPNIASATFDTKVQLKKTMSAAKIETVDTLPKLRKSSSAAKSGLMEKLYAPQCLVILSHHCFLDEYRAFLTELYRISLTPAPIPLERNICNFMLEVPLPPEGRTTVQYNIADKTIEFRRSPPNNPLEHSHFRLRLLFECLEVDKIELLMEAILMERRVLILCSQLSALAVVSETLVSLLFPFEWQHVYIPLLPKRLQDFLHAPLPYLIGMSSSHVPDDLKEQLIQHHEVVLVELDAHSVRCHEAHTRLPPKELRKLMKALEPMQQLYAAGKGVYASKLMDNMDLAFHYAPLPDEVEAENEHRVSLEREAILKERYQEFLILPSPGEDPPDLCFRVADFMRETKAFARFIEKCVQHELGEGEDDHRVLFFNESIVAKLNRSKFSKKRQTPFLDAKGYELKKTYVSPSPSTEGLSKKSYSSTTFPKLDPSLFVMPRIKPPNFRDSSARRGRPVAKSPPMQKEKLPVNIQRMMISQRLTYTVWFHIFTAIVGEKLKQEMAKGFTGRTNFLLTAFRVLDTMEEQGIRPEAEVFGVLMKACAVVVAPDDAISVLKRMKETGYTPDGTLQSAVLHIFAAAGESGKGKEELNGLGEKNGIVLARRRGSLKLKKEARLLESWAYQRSNMDTTHRAQVGMFEHQFPGLTIKTRVRCPECNRTVKDLEIREGWTENPHDYTTQCPDCSERFVARFTVRPSTHASELPEENITQADASAKEVISEYLSPWVLKKEVTTLVERREAEYLTSKEFRKTSPALFWNLVWHLITQGHGLIIRQFSLFMGTGLVIDFLLLEWLQSTQRSMHGSSRLPESAKAARSHMSDTKRHSLSSSALISDSSVSRESSFSSSHPTTPQKRASLRGIFKSNSTSSVSSNPPRRFSDMFSSSARSFTPFARKSSYSTSDMISRSNFKPDVATQNSPLAVRVPPLQKSVVGLPLQKTGSSSDQQAEMNEIGDSESTGHLSRDGVEPTANDFLNADEQDARTA